MDKNKKTYWRSPEHKAGLTKADKSDLPKNDPSVIDNRWSRRHFLGIMGASVAMASMAGCRRPIEKIVPYVTQPEGVTPGVPMYYATSMPFGGSGYGLIVECHEGRPTKIEPNYDHPSTPGGTDFLTQASVLNLYDPDRSKKVLHDGNGAEYDEFVAYYREQLEQYKASKGEGMAVLAETFSSPTMDKLKKDFDKALPRATWVTYDPISDENIFKAVQNLTGQQLRPVYKYDKADVILSLDADFLHTESEHTKAAFEYSKNRDIEQVDSMNRLYVVESNFSVTGASADHRYRLQPSKMLGFLVSLISELNKRGLSIPTPDMELSNDIDNKFIAAVADDLIKAGEKAMVVAGYRQSVIVHELALIINNGLKSLNNVTEFYELNDLAYSRPDDLKTLIDSMNNGSIKSLIVFGGNPVYNAPADLNIKSAMEKIETKIHFGEFNDETGKIANWHIPRSHYLESWGDVTAYDGTPGIIQPMIEPLYSTHNDAEFLTLIVSGENKRGYDIIRETWDDILGQNNFDKKWDKALHDGLVADKKNRLEKAKIRNNVFKYLSAQSGGDLEVGYYPSQVYDGRFANNGWLQELPDPISKLAWDNPALLSPKTAKDNNLENGDVIELKNGGNKLAMPVWIVPGHANNCLSLYLGYGRETLGRVADKVGFDTYKLRTSDSLHYGDIKFTKTIRKHDLANTQDHGTMMDRPIVRETDLKHYKKEPDFAHKMVEHPPLKSIYPPPAHDYSKGYQWGMVIDLNKCIGCNACIIACQSENNVPIVGKEQVANGREMHWIRLDRYFTGDDDNPEMVHMPMPCQQCENAPCESVCPVAATSHDREGLNMMTYNRCIGTRYCSNNCPYKVRRFNFFNYTNELPETVKMAQNPDVTVRFRGVMEKCTFCIQRINRNKQKANSEDRKLTDGDFMTACQQTCPTKAIDFGNILEQKSRVAQLKQKPRSYELLGELNTRPRNSYLAKVRNPNPALKVKKTTEDHG